jgi:hypothetical protein
LVDNTDRFLKPLKKADLQLEEDSFVQLESTLNSGNKQKTDLDINLNLDTEEQITSGVESEAEATTEADPMDPNYSDVDKIMKKYESEDADKELAAKHMALGSDPMGGIDYISAHSYAHNKDEDNKYLRTTFDTFSSAS